MLDRTPAEEKCRCGRQPPTDLEKLAAATGALHIARQRWYEALSIALSAEHGCGHGTRVLGSSLSQRETLFAVSVRVENGSRHHPHDLVPHVVGDGLGGRTGVVDSIEQRQSCRHQDPKRVLATSTSAAADDRVNLSS